jgi:glycosyltransferase involved in cell wall biosynthesis
MFEPAEVVEVELSAELRPIVPAPATPAVRSARALVRLHGKPLGTVDLALERDGLSAERSAQRIWSALRPEIVAHLGADGLPAPATLTARGLLPERGPAACRASCETESISVVIATRDRPAALARGLRSLLRMHRLADEVIVVDNAPATSATRDLLARDYPRVRYLREDRPGLAVAHNRGLGEATGAIVAFTDDDVTVDGLWLLELAAGFARDPRIGCVTGLILPAELRTPAQVCADRYWALQKGFREQLFTRPLRRLSASPYPYTAGRFGSGANMAFRAGMLRGVGGFDPLMGAGAPARGGDDLAAFFGMIAAGRWILYTPAALVWHWYPEDAGTLRSQAYGYGVGLSAYLTKLLADDPLRVLDFAARSPAALAHVRGLARSRRAGDGRPAELRRLERRGMASGPAAYLRGRRRTARARPS